MSRGRYPACLGTNAEGDSVGVLRAGTRLVGYAIAQASPKLSKLSTDGARADRGFTLRDSARFKEEVGSGPSLVQQDSDTLKKENKKLLLQRLRPQNVRK